MANSKLLRIFNEFHSRLSVIKKQSGYNTDIGLRVERGDYVFNSVEVPACCVFLGPGVVAENVGNSVKTQSTFTIRASIAFDFGDDTQQLVIDMLEDIHRAVEIPIDYKPGPSDMAGRATETDWRIQSTDSGSNVISLEIDYSFFYSRNYGED